MARADVAVQARPHHRVEHGARHVGRRVARERSQDRRERRQPRRVGNHDADFGVDDAAGAEQLFEHLAVWDGPGEHDRVRVLVGLRVPRVRFSTACDQRRHQAVKAEVERLKHRGGVNAGISRRCIAALCERLQTGDCAPGSQPPAGGDDCDCRKHEDDDRAEQ